MATTHWRKGYSVNQLFSENGVNWSFYQLARLLIGTGINEEELLIKLEQKISFIGSLSRSLPPGEIRKISAPSDFSDLHQNSEKYTVECAYYNIYGLDGPLVEPFTEMMCDDDYYGQGAMRAFINIFNNRIQALRYRVKAATHCTLTTSDASQHRIGQFLLALSGQYLPEQRQLSGQTDADLIALSGYLANCRLNFPTVCRILKTVLNLPVIEMQNLIGRWLRVDPEDHTHLGKCNHRLGNEATLGTKTWDQQAAFGLVIGPVPPERLNRLVPGGEEHPRLKRLIGWLAEKRCDCLLTIVCSSLLDGKENSTVLGKGLHASRQLGYGAALKSEIPTSKRVQFMLNIVEEIV